KTIITLQRQLQNEEMSGTFSILSEKVTYNNPLPNEINVVTPRRLTDAQRIHLKIPKFLEDLQRRGETTLQLEEAIGNTCLEQIRFLCESLGQTDLNPNISLQYYYLLGEKGLPNLLVTQTITPNALARMYDEDFNLLLQEARTQRFQEN
ncbi:24502_t:CDS:2, partial [Gigaspora rosea]